MTEPEQHPAALLAAELGPAAQVEALEPDTITMAETETWLPDELAVPGSPTLVVANVAHPLANRITELAAAHGWTLLLSPVAPAPPAVGVFR